MRTTHMLATAAAGLMLTAACAHQDPAQHNAEQYIEALAAYDFDAAMPYATEETQEHTLKYFRDAIMPIMDSAWMRSNMPATIHIDSIVYPSDSQATVHYTKRTPLQYLRLTLEMRKRGDQWLAHQPIKPATLSLGNATAQEGQAGKE